MNINFKKTYQDDIVYGWPMCEIQTCSEASPKENNKSRSVCLQCCCCRTIHSLLWFYLLSISWQYTHFAGVLCYRRQRGSSKHSSLKTTFSVCMGKFDAENRPFKLPRIRCKQTGYGFIYGTDRIRWTLSEGFFIDIGLYKCFLTIKLIKTFYLLQNL